MKSSIELIALLVILACLALFITKDASAAGSTENTLYLGAISDHYGQKGVKREKHSLVVYERNQFLGGYLKNSLDKNTFILGYRFSMNQGDFGEYLRFPSKFGDAGAKAGLSLFGYPEPVWATLYYQYGVIDINHVPDVVTSIGFKIDF